MITLKPIVRGQICTLEIGEGETLQFMAPWLRQPVVGDYLIIAPENQRVRAIIDWDGYIDPRDSKVLTECLISHLRAQA